MPLQYADQCYKDEFVMRTKYKVVDTVFDDWKNYFSFKRDKSREEYLFYDYFNLKEGDSYNLVNRWFGTGFSAYRKDIQPANEYKVVEMKNLGFDTIFDWCKVFEHATEIHSVHTSICYILETLNLKADKTVLYSRIHSRRN